MEKNKNLLLILSAVFFLFSCQKSGKVESISEDNLFSLNYGNFEEQLNLFSLNDVGDIKTGIYMQNGFFYIINGESKKIMELNSYGDLLSLYYSEDSLTESFIDNSITENNGILKPISYPFDYPGQICVDTNKTIYVVCSIPRDRQEHSEDDSLLYCQTVLRLSRNGEISDYLGQQGPGGTPFPFIKNIYTTDKNELVVVAIANDGMNVYWFGTDGFLKYLIPVSSNDIPAIFENGEEKSFYATLDNIIPSFTEYKLYCKVDYYEDYYDAETRVLSGVDYRSSILYPFDISTAMFDEGLNIPPYEESITVDFSRLTYKMPYDFIGVTKSGWKVFAIITETGFDIEMLHSDSQDVIKRHFDVNHKNVLYHSMALSSDGIICALYAEEQDARVVWYRTDKLIAK